MKKKNIQIAAIEDMNNRLFALERRVGEIEGEPSKGRILPVGNCPYCDAEQGVNGGWSMSPEGFAEMKRKHDEGHPKPQNTEECICNDYDGKGVSTCGFPCPVHKPQNTEVLREKIYNILLDASCNWIETEEAWKTANKLLALLVK